MNLQGWKTFVLHVFHSLKIILIWESGYIRLNVYIFQNGFGAIHGIHTNVLIWRGCLRKCLELLDLIFWFCSSLGETSTAYSKLILKTLSSLLQFHVALGFVTFPLNMYMCSYIVRSFPPTLMSFPTWNLLVNHTDASVIDNLNRMTINCFKRGVTDSGCNLRCLIFLPLLRWKHDS